MPRHYHRARDTLRGGERGSSKTLRDGFGMVRFLTTASQQNAWHEIGRRQIPNTDFRRATPPLHVTLVGFVGMSQREQRAFEAGFDVSRLEEKLSDEVPRPALHVGLGRAMNYHHLIYLEVDDERLRSEQAQLAGCVAMRGIEIERINKQVVPPHVTIGHAGHMEAIPDLLVEIDAALAGQDITLEAWRVYPERYA